MTPFMKIAADAYEAKERATEAYWSAMDILEDSIPHPKVGSVVAVPQHCPYPGHRGSIATITGLILNYEPERGFYWRIVADTQMDPESSDRNHVMWNEPVVGEETT